MRQNWDIISSSEEGSAFLLTLPHAYLKSICESDGLYITDERSLVTLFDKFLNHRNSLPLLKEEDPSQDWSHLNEIEIEGRKK
jgi:hypothetical protein